MAGRFRPLRLAGILAAVAAAIVVGVPAATAEEPSKISDEYLSHLSGSVALSYYAANPKQAPTRFKPFAQAAQQTKDRTTPRSSQYCQSNANKDVFNCDFIGLPQNEESVGACPTNDNLVLGSQNDYNGLLFGDNVTGWDWSVDGGHSVQNYGFLPPITLGTLATHPEVPSGGDPVSFIPAGCDSVYESTLAYDLSTVPFGPNGVAVYKSTPAILSSCAGFDDPSCWPVKRTVVESDGNVFNDKEWMFVGTQPIGGTPQRVVWVTWSEFANDENAPVGYNSAQIKAARCDGNLVTCTAPIPISVLGPESGAGGQTDLDVQFSDVTIGPDGRAYITWAGIIGELPGSNGAPGQPQTFVIRERTETAPGSAAFGPVHTVYTETNAIPFGGFLHANDFRVATNPKSDVTTVGGAPRIFVIWDACRTRFLDTSCQEPEIKLSYSLDPDGSAWSTPTVLSNGGDNYFATISADRTYGTNNLAAAWFSNYYDVGFHNAQDVQATSINPAAGQSRGLQRLTGPQSNESESDPLLGGVFIGDYIEGVLIKNRYYVHYNANYRQMQILGFFPPLASQFPLNQQDNYLTITGTS
jgi:hypothetical protein